MSINLISEKPILFSTPLVRAILANKKHETRRLPKFQPDSEPIEIGWFEHKGREVFGAYGENWQMKCPYGSPDSRLWVRETHSHDHAAFYPHFPIVYRADNLIDESQIIGGKIFSPEQNKHYPFKWRPSIFMRRKDSRINLTITDIGFERLQEITEDEAIDEGFESRNLGDDLVEARPQFIDIWDKLNAKRGYPWESNSWVWVVRFERDK